MNYGQLHGLAEVIGALFGGYGAIKWLPGWFIKITGNARLMAENQALREQNQLLRESLGDWKERVESLETSIEEFKIELAESVMYIADLVRHLRRGGSAEVPPIPERLKDVIQRAIDLRSDIFRETPASIDTATS